MFALYLPSAMISARRENGEIALQSVGIGLPKFTFT